MPLSDTAIRLLKPKTKPFKVADGGGLFLLVQPTGAKWWRYKYRFNGKEKLMALGAYPTVTLREARNRHHNARKLVEAGSDPSEAKRESKRRLKLKAENTFEALAREWCESRKEVWVTSYSEDMVARLERHIYPKLGHRPVAEISAPELLEAVRAVEESGARDMAKRLVQVSGQVFRYAIATGRAERNPAGDLRGALKPVARKHQAHLKEAELPEFLQKLESYDGHPQTKLAMRLLLLTFVRTIELRGAKWTEVDFEKAEWRIDAGRMKMREAHIVPLSKQAVVILEALKKLSGHREFVFPNLQRAFGCMSENTVLYALYRMGYHSRATGHGFRSTASTILNENGFAPDVIERQLAHCERNKVRAAYNHAQYLPERRKLMQWWADYLDDVPTKESESAAGDGRKKPAGRKPSRI